VAGFCEQGYAPSGSIKSLQFLEWLKNFGLSRSTWLRGVCYDASSMGHSFAQAADSHCACENYRVSSGSYYKNECLSLKVGDIGGYAIIRELLSSVFKNFDIHSG
jgi:hypothetical protein